MRSAAQDLSVPGAQHARRGQHRGIVAARQQAVLLERISLLEVDGQRLSQDIALSKALGGGYRAQTPVALRVR